MIGRLMIWLLMLFIAGLYSSCCSSHQDRDTSGVDSSSTHTSLSNSNNPNSLKKQSIRIDALVDSVSLIGDSDYRLYLRVISSQFIEGMEGLEHDAPLQVSPQFVRSDNNTLDANDDRNR